MISIPAMRVMLDAMEAYIPAGQRANARSAALAAGIVHAEPYPWHQTEDTKMQIEVVGDAPTWTDAPREMTPDEIAEVRRVGRLEAVKLHRQWTRSTLKAAIRCVDAALAGPLMP